MAPGTSLVFMKLVFASDEKITLISDFMTHAKKEICYSVGPIK